MMREVRASFRAQAASCETLGSPFTARLLGLLGDRLQPGTPVADCILNWPRDPSSRGDAVALRLAGGLHALVLQGQDADLQALYRDPGGFSDAAALQILLTAIETHSAALLAALSFAPQTNEVRRSAALIGAAHWLTARVGLPLVLSELGASAGLNLNWDRYTLNIRGQSFGPDQSAVRLAPDWHGALPPLAPPQIADRAAVDLNPLDCTADELRILSYIWADQPHRLDLTRAALALARQHAITVDKGDAIDWLEARLQQPLPGRLHLVCHTIAWQYFPHPAQIRGRALLSKAGARATASAPLAHLSMEADNTTPGAALVLQFWPGNLILPLGRVDFHGRWIDWQAPAP